MSKALEPGECPVGFLISEDGRAGIRKVIA